MPARCPRRDLTADLRLDVTAPRRCNAFPAHVSPVDFLVGRVHVVPCPLCGRHDRCRTRSSGSRLRSVAPWRRRRDPRSPSRPSSMRRTAAGAAPAAATPPSQDPVPSRGPGDADRAARVTLITGDIVELGPAGDGRYGATVASAPRRRHRPDLARPLAPPRAAIHRVRRRAVRRPRRGPQCGRAASISSRKRARSVVGSQAISKALRARVRTSAMLNGVSWCTRRKHSVT